VPLIKTPSAFSARVIRADAPTGLSWQQLGVPYDANFQPMVGEGAGTLFPNAGPPIVLTVNEVSSDRELITTQEHLKASAHYLVVNGDVNALLQKRFGVFRAVQLAQVYELRDNTAMNRPPPGAVYYPWRIYVGHSYTEVVEGDRTQFTAEVGAEFLKWGANVEVEESRHQLQHHVAGRGLKPTSGHAIFAQSPEEIQRSYTTVGETAPIVVEYRQIPNTRSADGSIAWEQSKPVQVRFTNLQVAADGSALYGQADWAMSFQCLVNGQPYGAAQPLQQRVSRGSYPLAFSQVLQVTGDDTVECKASGQYKRLGGWGRLGESTTGPIAASRLAGPTGSVMYGRDANTGYAINWTASR
jgi:hypothetical protein